MGAGASTEFGEMPIGLKLAQSIQARAERELRSGGNETEPPITDALSRSGGFRQSHREALARIRASITTKDSIDDFVSEWEDLADLVETARYCIAHEIIKGEEKTFLAGASAVGGGFGQTIDKLRGTWLDWVVRHTGSLPRRRLPEALEGTSFITFNYDRCIEFYLYHYMHGSAGLPPSDARSAVNAIKIEHVYGAAGLLPELGGHVPFGKVEPRTLALAAEKIRTYSQSVEDGDALRIRALVSQADRLVFLGCAFHPQNLDVLFGPGGGPDAEVWATTYGMRPRQVQNATTALARNRPVHRLDALKAGAFLEANQDDLF